MAIYALMAFHVYVCGIILTWELFKWGVESRKTNQPREVQAESEIRSTLFLLQGSDCGVFLLWVGDRLETERQSYRGKPIAFSVMNGLLTHKSGPQQVVRVLEYVDTKLCLHNFKNW